MKSRSNRIVFFGNEQLATGVPSEPLVLPSLVDYGYEVAAVVTSPIRRSSSKPEIAQLAQQLGIPVLSPDRTSDILDDLANYQADIGVLVAYGRLIPETVINVFPHGIVNIHPSLLPLHRGPTPVESAILSGDNQTGVSLMSLVKAMDAGPVFAQSPINLDGLEAKSDLARSLHEIGRAMLVEILPEILNGGLVAKPQDDSSATYDRLISKRDGEIDWAKPATQLEREIRAFDQWPKSQARLGNIDVIITSASVVETGKINLKVGRIETLGNKLVVQTGKDALEIIRLKPAGKSEMTANEFIRGYRSRLKA